jgi:phosphatidylglycerol:prolipoprotein diacylglycerol transferase
MYPRLSDFLERLLGVDLPFDIYSFGAMVAVAILVAAWIASKELDRMYASGLIAGVRVPETKAGKRVTYSDVSPSSIMGTVTVITVFGGFAGAKLFHILENLDDFFAAPLSMIFSSGGFTFYGGLVFASIGVVWYVKKKGLGVGRFIDAVAPTLILAYGIGRIGCHLAGDGDWGIESDPGARPAFLPEWLWAETYPNNILTGAPLPAPVYPTSLYEFAAGLLLFGFLWMIRKHKHAPGWLFSMYLLVAGIERFVIEKIRVNNEFDLLGFSVTQAEVISIALVALGVLGLARTWMPRPGQVIEGESPENDLVSGQPTG